MPSQWGVRSSVTEVSSLGEVKQLLFQQRSIADDRIAQFFQPTYEEAIYDPYSLYGMEEAVERIYRAIKNQEHIIVYGDYDADGITATATLLTALSVIGAQAIPYLPHRLDDGYGLHLNIAKSLSREASLIITVDCGVANIEEIAWLSKHGTDVIVVDHHEMKDELPSARAVLHPRHPDGTYAWGYLSGSGMAWKLSQALLRSKYAPRAVSHDAEKWLLDLAMLGTVGDIVPLLDENRAIVRFGLEVLRRTQRPGLKALMEKAKASQPSMTAQDVSFKIIPRLNAPGRLEHSQPALDLLLAKDAGEAYVLAQKIEAYNTMRQSVGRKVTREAEAQVNQDFPVIFAYDISWPAGVVGLAANQLAKKFNRPAIVVGGNGRHAVGSARTPSGYNILDILSPYKDELLAMGGHAHAAGFSVTEATLPSLQEALQNVSVSSQEEGSDISSATAVLNSSLISWDTAELLRQFEPFGHENEQPSFIFKRLPIISARAVGKQATHAKFTFDVNGSSVEGIGFSLADTLPSLQGAADVMATPVITYFRGRSRLELSCTAIAPAGTTEIVSTI